MSLRIILINYVCKSVCVHTALVLPYIMSHLLRVKRFFKLKNILIDKFNIHFQAQLPTTKSWQRLVVVGKTPITLNMLYRVFQNLKVFMIAINALLTLIVFGVNCTCNVQKRKTGLWGLIEFGLHVYEWILGL